MKDRKTFRWCLRNDGGANENTKDSNTKGSIEKIVNINFYGPVFFLKKASFLTARNPADKRGRRLGGPVNCLSPAQIEALHNLPPPNLNGRRQCKLS